MDEVEIRSAACSSEYAWLETFSNSKCERFSMNSTAEVKRTSTLVESFDRSARLFSRFVLTSHGLRSSEDSERTFHPLVCVEIVSAIDTSSASLNETLGFAGDRTPSI